ARSCGQGFVHLRGIFAQVSDQRDFGMDLVDVSSPRTIGKLLNVQAAFEDIGGESPITQLPNIQARGLNSAFKLRVIRRIEADHGSRWMVKKIRVHLPPKVLIVRGMWVMLRLV